MLYTQEEFISHNSGGWGIQGAKFGVWWELTSLFKDSHLFTDEKMRDLTSGSLLLSKNFLKTVVILTANPHNLWMLCSWIHLLKCICKPQILTCGLEPSFVGMLGAAQCALLQLRRNRATLCLSVPALVPSSSVLEVLRSVQCHICHTVVLFVGDFTV